MTVQPKLCCAAWGWREWEAIDFFHAAANLGFPAVEVSMADNTPLHLTGSPTAARVAYIARTAERAGVTIACVSGYCDFGGDDHAHQFASIRRQVEVAADLGAFMLRLYTDWHGANYPDSHVPKVYDALRFCHDLAAIRGVVIVVENHGGMSATGAQCRELMAACAGPNLGLCYDASNFRWHGEDPLAALRLVLPDVRHTHWKDVRFGSDGQPYWCAVGKGTIQWPPIIAELRRANYDGYWAIEYEDPNNVVEGTQAALSGFQEAWSASEVKVS